MPYDRNVDLPKSVRGHLPAAAQTIYRKAFNAAWKEYQDPGKRRGGADREETSHRVAWAAVKGTYTKQDGKWVRKD